MRGGRGREGGGGCLGGSSSWRRHRHGGEWVLTLVPWVLVTRVLPTWRLENMVGALMSYQSFLVKGSTLQW